MKRRPNVIICQAQASDELSDKKHIDADPFSENSMCNARLSTGRSRRNKPLAVPCTEIYHHLD